ncbi:alpha/beta fold family hydrolase [Actinobacillus pleuropneumoniae]|uniref:Alpha/beta fold family hydrolase n=1 Tax=Actinobacillus pleuropneumoniae TaxID=715 RepID=A0A448TZ18_ACTPL|nr:alpha/beta fold family hydrolase [Actinobacillus pleuropneumoniae]
MKIRTKLTALSSALLLSSTFIGGNAMANLPQSLKSQLKPFN